MIKQLYDINIYEKYKDLIKSGKTIDNNDLWKIFEWFTCIKLTEQYNTQFYEYNDISPEYKEQNNMSYNDTGIDACNLIDTIVQCKLRKDTLTLKDCATFLASQTCYDDNLNQTIIKWKKLIISRNECKLSDNLKYKSKVFIDKVFPTNDIIDYCNNLLVNKPKYPINDNNKIQLRDYQIEAINLIKSNNKNIIICLPTGCGKNLVIINSFEDSKKYLILVPRIILMEQLNNEIIKQKIELKNSIQCIGDNNNQFDDTKNITICVYNSVKLIEPYFNTFHKIYIDEAHHINQPMIYSMYEDNIESNDDTNNYTNDNTNDDTNNDTNENTNDDTNDESDNDDYYSDNESIKSDDSEDELKESSCYNQIIKTLTKYNNNVYLSATIDNIEGFIYYKKDIRDMIEHNYLCDYTINIPIFNNDAENKNICEYLIKNYRNVIIYCNSRKEGMAINKLLNDIQKGSSMYIDCKTPKKSRTIAINKYKNGEIAFLVNVKILVEGFDAPITKGVCFLHLPYSKTTLIQIIGRCLRLHPLKTIANVILPYSNNDDEKNISNFMKVMANNDRRIKQAYENKKLNGYIYINQIYENEDDEIENNNIEFKYNMIYNSMGKLLNGEEIWEHNLELVKKYLDEHCKRPSSIDKNINIRDLGVWVSYNLKCYKNRTSIMKIDSIYNKFHNIINNEKYKQYFLSNIEYWNKKFNELIKYLDTYNKIPDYKNKDLQTWTNIQLNNYKKKKQIMQNKEIYDKFSSLINSEKYKSYFLSKYELWNINFMKVFDFINKYNRRPSGNNDEKYLSKWLNHNMAYYRNKTMIMQDDKVYNIFSKFINDNKYKIHFMSNKEKWSADFNKLILYINKYKIKPSRTSKDIEIKYIAGWLHNQLEAYKQKSGIMLDIEIYNKFNDFLKNDEYKGYFKNNYEIWYENFNKLISYININKKTPTGKYDKFLSMWLSDQKKNYNKKINSMKDQNIYNTFNAFINDQKYKQYFT